MNHLSSEYNNKIMRYLDQIKSKIAEIELGERKNYKIHNNDFINPTVCLRELPINHQQGELVYYQKIREGLEIALEEGFIPTRFYHQFVRAPIRIRGLLERDDPERLG